MRTTTQFFKEVVDFFYQLYTNRNLIRTLSWRDFEKRYSRNFFGFFWALMDPLAFIVILYFVFSTRYGNATREGVPFVVYLISGYIAFDLFTTGLTGVTGSINEHSYLLKKVNFRVAILPISPFQPKSSDKPSSHRLRVHMRSREAVKAHLDLGAQVSIAAHFRVFQLGPDGFDDAVQELTSTLELRNLKPDAFLALDPGQSYELITNLNEISSPVNKEIPGIDSEK